MLLNWSELFPVMYTLRENDKLNKLLEGTCSYEELFVASAKAHRFMLQFDYS